MQKDRILPDQIPLRDPYRCHKSKSYDKIKFTLEHFFFLRGECSRHLNITHHLKFTTVTNKVLSNKIQGTFVQMPKHV